ncbi:sigma-E processing peptidase SpoIIGA [Paenibacillus turpanensis]|uniref:sigma-E processing peptidase SpoIIGA n=1 Tax=Paenibacillus turpanensis TaxID=2689078 RepID=UPI00140D7E02|nr:sigma-E processing peptidase SpoIIGA [Paenibacillus turpanensis]
MIVYLDLLFFTNLFIDAVTLKTTAWVVKKRVKAWRLLLGAAIGASYVVMMFFPSLSAAFTFLVKCLFSAVMIMTVFGFQSLQNFLRQIGAFYVVNFAAAAAIIALHFLLQTPQEIRSGMWFAQSGGVTHGIQVSMWFVLLVFAPGIFLFKQVFKGSERRQRQSGYLATVQVWIGDAQAECRGIIDTGNKLYDPLTRTPVMVMEASLWEERLPPSFMDRIRDHAVDRIVSDKEMESFAWQDRLRLVPYRGVGAGTKFMLALKPDRVVIDREGTVTESRKVLIGLDGGTLSSDGDYRAIIHPELAEQAG